MTSPDLTASPSFLCHFARLPFSMVGESAGINTCIADLPIFVLGCCELHSQKQAQLKVGAFEPQPSVYQN